MTEEIVKGFKDKLGRDAEKAAFIRGVARETFGKYGFAEIETPIVEYEEFMKKGANSGDEVISDIFRLRDKGGRELGLRYEFTFQLKRVFKNQKLPFKRFQIGPVFRDEPVRGNRLRQFTQCDIDTIGGGIAEQAEILGAVAEIFKKLGVKFKIFVNNRQLLNEILEKFGVKNKVEVIRELDKLDKLSKREVQENLEKLGAREVLDFVLNKKQDFQEFGAYENVRKLMDYCKYYDLEIEFSPTLARGLSYYTGNVFEIKSDIRETICGGGAYEVRNVEAVGISFSIERMMAVVGKIPSKKKTLVISIGEKEIAIKIANKIRREGNIALLYFGKISKALDYANSYGVRFAVFVGSREVREGKFRVKDLNSGKEKLVSLDKITQSI